jgi:hypothetical protein
VFDATPLFRRRAARRARAWATWAAASVQEQTLLRLVRTARKTRFGRDHDFSVIRGVADFQARVPLRTYEQFWADYWRAAYPRLTDLTWPGTIPFIAVSSGTTSGATKYIPVSHAMVRANRDAALDLMCHHVLNRPDSRIFGGKNLILGGSTAFTAPARGIQQGDLSGIAAATIPAWARSRVFPPRDLALIEDWEDKVERLAEASLGQPITSINGTPSWLLLFLRRVAARAGGTLADAYPKLEMIAHGGISFAPYRAAFEALLAGTRAETRELYPASEGFVAIADRGPGDGLRLNLDHGVFCEFVPLDELAADRPTRHWVATVETGVNYAIVLSSCAGLWAYVLGDTVRFVDRVPPRLLITGRTAYMLSAFGEHVIAEELEGAVADAAAAIGAAVGDFSAGAIHPPEARAPGGHLVIVEFAEAVAADAVARFAAALDRGLAERNLDYRAHRAGDFGMAPPRVVAVPPGRFAAWMKQRGKLGGQHKVPRIITDPALLDALRRFVA